MPSDSKSSLTWKSHETSRWLGWTSGPYRILAARPLPNECLEPWWIARRNNVEIASGYGEPGLEKCKRECERHEQKLQQTAVV